MGSSFVPPQAFPAKTVNHPASGSVITNEMRGTTMIHRLVENGLTAEFPVRYQIGGGMMGATFAVQVHDYLFESPLSWFDGFGWDASPGYSSVKVLDFDRTLTKTCLYCHASGARFDDPDGRHLTSNNLEPITCDRCHGPGDEHALHPTAKNILNPAKLSGPARESICEQCHLEGAARVLNPGKDWIDFHLGEAAERTFATYVVTGGDSRDVIPASEVEQLSQSHCAQASQGKLWCGSCHNPHVATGDRQQAIKAVCTSCHQKPSPQFHPAALTECTSCHMPSTSATFMTHASHTDHRILRNPANAPVEGGPEKLVAWREPPEAFRKRDTGVAELMLPADKYEQLRRNGADLLLSLSPQELERDPDALTELEGFYFQAKDFGKAIEWGKRAEESNPKSGAAALNLAIALERSGDAAGAEHQFLKAIELDPSLKDAYGRLAMLYVRMSRYKEANEIIDRYLQWNPNEILFRSIKQKGMLNH